MTDTPDNLPLVRHRRGRVASVEGPDPIDIHVGSRVRLRRVLIGMRQMALAANIGVTWQQVQKYESGANRISASSLYRIAGALDVPISFFFDDLGDGWIPPATLAKAGRSLGAETSKLVSFYCGIPPRERKHVFKLVRAMAQAPAEGDP